MANPCKAVVQLTNEQRQHLQQLSRTGRHAARVVLRARALLLADADHPQGQRTDSYIVAATGIKLRTLVRLRQQFVGHGLEAALQRKVRTTPPVPPKITGRLEAQLIALACSPAPAGHTSWSTALLARELTRLEYVSTIGRETVRRALKKMRSSPGGRSASASPRRTARASSPRWSRC
jgi:hypothetical protein